MLSSKASKVLEDVPGREVNLYHYSSDTVKKSKIATYQSTNGYFSLNSKDGGSTSTVIIPPNHSLEKIILGVELPKSYFVAGVNYDTPVANTTAMGSGAYDGCALPAGWIYSMIRQINYRIAGSADFSISGEGLRAACLMNASNSGQKQQLLTALGGAAIAGRSVITEVSDFQGPNLSAYAVLSVFGLSSQSGGETPCGLPTASSNGPITITIQWRNFSDVFATNGTAQQGVAPLPTAFNAAWIQTRQLFPIDSSDELRLTGNQKYMYPITYYQQPLMLPLQGSSTSITGIKEGQCRGMYLQFSRKSLYSSTASPAAAANATTFLQVKDIKITYNGVVLHRFDSLGSAQMLDTLYSDVSGYYESKVWVPVTPAANTVGFVVRTDNNGGPYAISNYYHCPFSQRFEQFSGMSDMTLMNGISLGAGSIQVEFGEITDPAQANAVVPATDVMLQVMPYLVAALEFDAMGNVQYVF